MNITTVSTLSNERPSNRSIARNAGYLLLARVTSRTLRVVYMVALARGFGPELFALFSYAQFWQVIFMSVAVFGTGRILSRQIGSDRDNAAQHVAESIALRSITTMVASIACLLVALCFDTSTMGQRILLVFALTIIPRSLASWAQQLFIAYQVTRLGLRQELLFRSLEVVLGFIAMALGGDLLVLAMIHFLSWGLQAVAGCWVVRTRLIPIHFSWRCSRLIRLARTGLAFMLVSLAFSFMVQGGLILYKNFFPNVQDLGQLAMVLQLLGLSLMIPKSVAATALPVLSHFVVEGEGSERRSMMLMLQIAIVGAAGLALFGMVVSPVLIPLIVGEAYRPAAELIGPTLWLLVPLSLGTLMNQLLIAHGHFWLTAASTGLGAVVMAAIIGISIDAPNISLILLATGMGATVWAISGILFATHQGWLRPAETFARAGFVVALATAACYLLSDFSAWLALLVAWLMLVPSVVPLGLLVNTLKSKLPCRY